MIIHEFSWSGFYKMPLVGILRNVPPAALPTLSGAFKRAGLSTLEVTVNSESFFESMELLRGIHGSGLNIGAGTVCSPEDLQKAIAAGAQFIVTPVVCGEVITACVSRRIPVFAGAYTPTEIWTAWKLGADMVKVFPAGEETIRHMKAVRGPFPGIRLLPTGGVSLENAGAFLEAGAAGLGLGGELFPKSLLVENDPDKWYGHFRRFAFLMERF